MVFGRPQFKARKYNLLNSVTFLTRSGLWHTEKFMLQLQNCLLHMFKHILQMLHVLQSHIFLYYCRLVIGIGMDRKIPLTVLSSSGTCASRPYLLKHTTFSVKSVAFRSITKVSYRNKIIILIFILA